MCCEVDNCLLVLFVGRVPSKGASGSQRGQCRRAWPVTCSPPLPAALLQPHRPRMLLNNQSPASGPLHLTFPLPLHVSIKYPPAHSLTSFWSLLKYHFLGDIATTPSSLGSPPPPFPQCPLPVLSSSRGQGFPPLCSALRPPSPPKALAHGGCPVNTHQANNKGKEALCSLLRPGVSAGRCWASCLQSWAALAASPQPPGGCEAG